MTHPAPNSMPIHLEALESHVGILGKTGSGKSNAAKVVAEILMARGRRVCIVDPTGTWWGLRLAPNGAKSPFEPVIFGGAHGDIAIEGAHGAAIGEAVATSSTSAIVDTRGMTVNGRNQFFTGFAETLLKSNRGILHLIIDEAHVFAPQTGGYRDPQRGQMLHAANNLVSLGRGIGLRIILISQRPAKLHNDSLSQVETLVAMRLLLPHDKEAVKAWIRESADPETGKEIMASLASLKTGEAWIWSPGLEVLERAFFPLCATFDSGKPGDIEDVALEPIDVAAMTEKLGQIRADVVANDPRQLKRRIAELERQVNDSTAIGDTREQEGFRRGMKEAERAKEDGINEGWNEGRGVGISVVLALANKAVANIRRAVEAEEQEFIAAVERETHAAVENPQWTEEELAEIAAQAKPGDIIPLRKIDPGTVITSRRNISSSRGRENDGEPANLGAERKPLAVLVQSHPGGCTEADWAMLAGFKRKGGTWGTYKSRLRTAGLIEQRGALWYATAEAIAALGKNIEPMPDSAAEIVDMWRGKLAGVGPMLDVLLQTYPDSLTRDGLAEATGLTASGGTFGTYLSRLRTNGLIEEPTRGEIRLSPAIMGELA